MATEVVRLGPGKHTVVAVGGENGVDLLVYQDDGVKSGKATLRAIHVASEVGKADVRVDGKVVATGVGLGDATGYLAVPPGRHSVAVTRPGGEGGPLVEANVRAVAGTAASGFVVGSAGMPAQIVLTADGTAGPVTAPATGLGGATSGGGWLLIIGSSLIGGTLGGTSYVLARRRRGRGALQVAAPVVAAGPPSSSTVAAGPPSSSTVAAGPPVGAEEANEPEAQVPPAEPTPHLIEALTPPAPTPVVPAVEIATNGNGHDPELQTDEAPPPPAPALWTPPRGERWESPAPSPRFVRADAQVEPPATSSRFVRSDAEVESVVETPSSGRFARENGAAAADFVPAEEPGVTARASMSLPPLATESEIIESEQAATLAPWGGVAAPEPEAAATVEAPMMPEPPQYDAWTGAWIPEPAETPAPEEPTLPEPAAEPVAELAEATVTAEPLIEAPELELTVPETETPVAEVEPVQPEPVAEVEPIDAEPLPEVVDGVVVPEPSVEETKALPVSTWSTTMARPGTATSSGRAHRVNFLLVSGAALVVTGLVVARRGGRH